MAAYEAGRALGEGDAGPGEPDRPVASAANPGYPPGPKDGVADEEGGL